MVVFLSPYNVDAEGFVDGEEEQTMDGPIVQKMFTQPARKVSFSKYIILNIVFPLNVLLSHFK